jgi:hypothetical protein
LIPDHEFIIAAIARQNTRQNTRDIRLRKKEGGKKKEKLKIYKLLSN